MSDQMDKFKARVLKAVQEAISKGHVIYPNRWGVLWENGRWHAPYKTCCPLGALLLKEQPDYSCASGLNYPLPSYFEKLFKIPEVEMFMQGVDQSVPFADFGDMYKFGKEMRKRLYDGTLEEVMKQKEE